LEYALFKCQLAEQAKALMALLPAELAGRVVSDRRDLQRQGSRNQKGSYRT
jgi:hypothetical protein